MNEAKINYKEHLLMSAIYHNNQELVFELLNNGADSSEKESCFSLKAS
jgi:hypothetical protein